MAALGIAVLFILTSTWVAQAGEPTQVDRGKATYSHYCSACHGDVGQGLTDEWRSTWPPEDQNCWQSKCHALNHPPEGFIFPKKVPALIGPGTLTRFQTALQLQGFIRGAMPYYQPGLLSNDQYWDIAAFLSDAHGVPLKDELTPANAGAVLLQPASQPEVIAAPANNALLPIAVVAGVGIVICVLILGRAAANRRTR